MANNASRPVIFKYPSEGPLVLIDSTGATIDFLLAAVRDAAAAKRLFCQALSDPSHPPPRVIKTIRRPSTAQQLPH